MTPYQSVYSVIKLFGTYEEVLQGKSNDHLVKIINNIACPIHRQRLPCLTLTLVVNRLDRSSSLCLNSCSYGYGNTTGEQQLPWLHMTMCIHVVRHTTRPFPLGFTVCHEIETHKFFLLHEESEQLLSLTHDLSTGCTWDYPHMFSSMKLLARYTIR